MENLYLLIVKLLQMLNTILSLLLQKSINMASVDGSKSWLGASDEIYDMVCGPCKTENLNKEAKHYCEQCQEHLCDACQGAHRKLKATKNHSILSGRHMPKASGVTPRPVCSVYCSCNQNREVVVYCEDHDDVICDSCATVKHRRCKTFSIRNKSRSYATKKFDSIIDKTKTLRMKIGQLLQERSKDRTNHTRMKDTCRKEISTFRKELNDFLDHLERDIIQNLEKHEKKRKQLIDDQIKSLTTTLQMIDLDYKLLEEAKYDNKAETMFSSDIKISKNLSEYETVLDDLQNNFERSDLYFQRNSKLVELQQAIDSLGSIKEKDFVSYKGTSTKVVLGMNVQSSSQHNVQLDDDKEKTGITGCCFMPSGDLVICDHFNCNFKLLDRTFKVKVSLSLNGRPWSFSAIDNNNVIVTIPDTKQLQYVQLVPHMKAGRVIKLDKKCFGVAVVDNEIYVSCHNNPGEGEVRVLDLSGNLKRKLGVNKDGSYQFQGPNYLTVSTTGKKIFVSDWSTSIISCMTPDGNIIYQYKDGDLRCPEALFVDAGDNIFVCDCPSQNVQVITADGRKYGTLISVSDGIRLPYSIAFRESDNILVVCCWNKTNIFCYKLSQ